MRVRAGTGTEERGPGSAGSRRSRFGVSSIALPRNVNQHDVCQSTLDRELMTFSLQSEQQLLSVTENSPAIDHQPLKPASRQHRLLAAVYSLDASRTRPRSRHSPREASRRHRRRETAGTRTATRGSSGSLRAAASTKTRQLRRAERDTPAGRIPENADRLALLCAMGRGAQRGR